MATKKEANLHHAMVKVMQEVKNIEKGLTVGSGSYSYKGVSDKDVKQQIGQAMAKNGLTCVPIKVEPTTSINRWEEVNNYKQVKQKMSVFVEVISTFRITHADTKESIEIVGYGHGQDTSDKAAGKATTYALKNALLYSFLVPTGDIDDTDSTHSNEMEQAPPPKPEMTDAIYAEALPHILSGAATMAAMENKYKVSVAHKKAFNKALAEKAQENIAKTEKEGAAKMTAKSQTVIDESPEMKPTEEAKEQSTEISKEEKAPEKPKKTDKKPAKEQKNPVKEQKKAAPKVEEAEIIDEASGFDKVIGRIDEYTSSDALIKDKNVIELDIRLERLTEEETSRVKDVVNDKYQQLKDANL